MPLHAAQTALSGQPVGRALDAHNSSVQTASLQCLRAISKGWIFILGQITRKMVDCDVRPFCIIIIIIIIIIMGFIVRL